MLLEAVIVYYILWLTDAWNTGQTNYYQIEIITWNHIIVYEKVILGMNTGNHGT